MEVVGQFAQRAASMASVMLLINADAKKDIKRTCLTSVLQFVKRIVGLEYAFPRTSVTVMKGILSTLSPRLVNQSVMADVRMGSARPLVSALVIKDIKRT